MKQLLTFEEIKDKVEIQTYLKHTDFAFATMGYKEHGLGHALYCANLAQKVLKDLGYNKKGSKNLQKLLLSSMI